ncbi:hypothetical protein BDY17DRAFT_327434 [Neohortaea acidophila]|uniref:Stress-response A/B barrel domain-containing protein n=1 Tax=Neohortaea acidophila TaxID=245834 RepID=A0A6A6PHH0_9PEZI|nr:uncharacterized protein BDY17DRAFT_327434 [Neohortaea acidophila]KAF2479468.1 hypothetical protein BDY17DRAFT_327434 [Neohortaea acidophila]
MSSGYVKRTTLFKIPEKNIDLVLKQYEVLRKTAVKDGKPYIVSNVARRITNTSSPLSEGFTISSQSVFRSKEDHDFYDKECPAHAELKKVTGSVRTGIMTVVTEGEWPEPKL